MILIIVLEHMMLLVKLGISAAIPDVPHHVAVQVQGGHDEEANDKLFDPAGKGRV